MLHTDRLSILASVALVGLSVSVPAFAQTPGSDQYKSLKAFSEVSLLSLGPAPSDSVTKTTQALGLDPRALADVVRLALSKNLPSLRVGLAFPAGKPRLILRWTGDERAVFVSLQLWRWVRIEEMNESVFVFVNVWQAARLQINPSRRALRDLLEEFTTEFAADYLQANR